DPRPALAARAAGLPAAPGGRWWRAREAPLRDRAPASGTPAVGAARVRDGGSAGTEGPGAAGGGRRRPLRQRRSGTDVLAPRSARQAVSEEPERSLPPRALPALARKRRRRPTGAAARAQPRTADPAGRRGGEVPRTARRNQGPLKAKIGRSAYANVRHIWHSAAILVGRLTGHQVAASLSALTGGEKP